MGIKKQWPIYRALRDGMAPESQVYSSRETFVLLLFDLHFYFYIPSIFPFLLFVLRFLIGVFATTSLKNTRISFATRVVDPSLRM
jgi:hypothetical protein